MGFLWLLPIVAETPSVRDPHGGPVAMSDVTRDTRRLVLAHSGIFCPELETKEEVEVVLLSTFIRVSSRSVQFSASLSTVRAFSRSASSSEFFAGVMVTSESRTLIG